MRTRVRHVRRQCWEVLRYWTQVARDAWRGAWSWLPRWVGTIVAALVAAALVSALVAFNEATVSSLALAVGVAAAAWAVRFLGEPLRRELHAQDRHKAEVDELTDELAPLAELRDQERRRENLELKLETLRRDLEQRVDIDFRRVSRDDELPNQQVATLVDQWAELYNGHFQEIAELLSAAGEFDYRGPSGAVQRSICRRLGATQMQLRPTQRHTLPDRSAKSIREGLHLYNVWRRGL